MKTISISNYAVELDIALSLQCSKLFSRKRLPIVVDSYSHEYEPTRKNIYKKIEHLEYLLVNKGELKNPHYFLQKIYNDVFNWSSNIQPYVSVSDYLKVAGYMMLSLYPQFRVFSEDLLEDMAKYIFTPNNLSTDRYKPNLYFFKCITQINRGVSFYSINELILQTFGISRPIDHPTYHITRNDIIPNLNNIGAKTFNILPITSKNYLYYLYKLSELTVENYSDTELSILFNFLIQNYSLTKLNKSSFNKQDLILQGLI